MPSSEARNSHSSPLNWEGPHTLGHSVLLCQGYWQEFECEVEHPALTQGVGLMLITTVDLNFIMLLTWKLVGNFRTQKHLFSF